MVRREEIGLLVAIDQRSFVGRQWRLVCGVRRFSLHWPAIAEIVIELMQGSWGREMRAITAPPGQTLGPHQQGRDTGLVYETRCQCHGVSGLAEKTGPHTFAKLRRLVGQNPHIFPALQGAQQLPR